MNINILTKFYTICNKNMADAQTWGRGDTGNTKYAPLSIIYGN